MALDRIDNYIDKPAFSSDTQFAIDNLSKLQNQLLAIKDIKLSLSGVDSMGKLVPVIKEVNSATAQYERLIKELELRKEKLNGTTAEFTKLLNVEAKTQKELAAAALLQAKASNESAKAKQGEAKSTEQSAKAKEREKKLIDEATNDYLQLSRAYNEASLKAKNYVLRLGENHPIAVQAVKDANDLGNVLKKLDASVGQNQRNVGNYTSAFNGLGFSFTQVARELPSLAVNFQQFALAISNNLPMVADELAKAKTEIAALKAEGKEAPSLLSRIGSSLLSWQVGLSVGIALLTAYAGKIKDWVTELVTGKENTDKLAESQKKLADAIREVDSARQDSIKANKQSNDESLNQLNRQVELADASGASETKLLALRIKVAERKKEIADNEIANQISIAEREKDTQDLQKTGFDAIKTSLETAEIEYFQYTDQIIKLSNERIIAVAQEHDSTVKSLDKQIEAAKAGQAAAQARGDAYRNALQSQFDADTELQKLRLLASNKYNDAERKAAFELFKFRKEQAIEAAKAVVQISQGPAKDNARARQAQLEKELIIGIAQFELTEKDITRSKVKLIKQKQAAEEKEIARNLIVDLITFQQEERAALLAAADETSEALNEKQREIDEKRKAQVRQNAIDNLTFGFEQRQRQIEENASLELRALAKSFAKGKVSKERYEKEKLDIERKARIDSINAEIAYYEKLILLSDLNKEEQKKAIEALHKLRVKLRAEESKADEDDHKKTLERVAALKSLGKELAGLTFDILTGGIEKQKNAIQDLIDKLDQQKQKDIEVANQTIANAQDRAAAIAIIEARAAAQKQQLELKQRQLDQQKARFERARQISEIIGNTAVAVAKALPDFILAAIVGAIGAAQVVRVLATPIPRYKHGKNLSDTYEGPAIVGDGGKKEAIIRENGNVEITPDRPTLTYVKSKDIILPNTDMLINKMHSNQLNKINNHTTVTPAVDFTPVNDTLKKQFSMLNRTIANKKELHIKSLSIKQRFRRDFSGNKEYLNANDITGW